MAKHCTRKNRVKIRRFDKKWSKIINDTIARMGDSTMPELFVEFEKIKEQMASEIQERGLRM
jgi:hypothetical protein